MHLTFYPSRKVIIAECDPEELMRLRENASDQAAELFREIDTFKEECVRLHGSCQIEVRAKWEPAKTRKAVRPMRVS